MRAADISLDSSDWEIMSERAQRHGDRVVGEINLKSKQP